MSLFSKKTYTCAICGKTVVSRISLVDCACDECLAKLHIEGYTGYRNDLLGWTSDTIPYSEYPQVAARRDAILEKYRYLNPITDEEMDYVADNYKKLPQLQITDLIVRMQATILDSTLGATYANGFFALSKYDDVYVDAADIFAVAFTSDYKLDNVSSEAILCAVFTNDPYVPVFPMVYEGKKGFLEVFKSKKGRAAVSAYFESICPNLRYPVSDIKELKKTIKSANRVEGNLDPKFMLDRIFDASCSSGIFNTKKMEDELTNTTVNTLRAYGYHTSKEFTEKLHMDGMFSSRFWKKEIERVVNGR